MMFRWCAKCGEEILKGMKIYNGILEEIERFKEVQKKLEGFLRAAGFFEEQQEQKCVNATNLEGKWRRLVVNNLGGE